VRSLAHQSLDKGSGVIAGFRRPVDQAFRGHARMALMSLGHMFPDGGMAAPLAAPGM